MVVANRGCSDFPKPKNPASFSAFYGNHSATGRSTGGRYDYSAPSTGAGDNSAGGEDYRGYDPRLYAEPPQGPPPTTPPPDPGGGAGPGTGDPGGGTGGVDPPG